jgi:hypothetical protein
MRAITKKLIKQVMDDMPSRGIIFSEKKFLSLMENSKELMDDWNEVGDYDTVFRELFVQAIVDDCEIKANNGFWPTHSDNSKVTNAFCQELKEKAPAKGYELKKGFSLR